MADHSMALRLTARSLYSLKRRDKRRRHFKFGHKLFTSKSPAVRRDSLESDASTRSGCQDAAVGEVLMKHRTILPVLLAAALLFGAAPGALPNERPPILVYVTWDGTPGALVERLLAGGRLPNLQRLVASGVHVSRTVGNWPSITPAGHAALWTGAYSSVNGISTSIPDVLTGEEGDDTNGQAMYGPVDAYGPSPFSAENLLVEPIWVTAARDGLSTTAVSVTNASPFEMYTSDNYVSTQGAQAFGDFSDQLLLSDPYRTVGLPPVPASVSPSVTAASDWENLPASPDASFRSFTLGDTPSGADEDLVPHGLAVAPDGEVLHPRRAEPGPRL